MKRVCWIKNEMISIENLYYFRKTKIGWRFGYLGDRKRERNINFAIAIVMFTYLNILYSAKKGVGIISVWHHYELS